MSEHSTHIAGASHSTLKGYAVGFILSVILTAIPFGMVMNGSVSPHTLLWIVSLCAIVQVLVHLVCFLHLNTSSEQRWNLLALVFTVIVIGIVVIGSLWIMHNMNMNMMPR